MENTTDYIAYVAGNEILYKSELIKKSNNLALYLKNSKVNKVVIYGHKNTYMLISMLGCLKAAVTYIVCDENIPMDRVATIINDSKADLVINTVDKNIISNQLITLNDLIKITENKDLESKPEVLEYKDFEKIKEKTAYIVYTSGSTGKPKGIEITYENLLSFISWFDSLSFIKDTKPSIILNQALFSFDLSVVDIFYSLINKATLYCLTKDDIENYNQLFNVIKKSNAEMMTFTPTFLEFCLCESSFNDKELKNLKLVLLCGEILKPQVAIKFRKRFRNVKIVNAYGPSEATCFVTAIEIKDDAMLQNNLPIGNINNSACNIIIVDEQNNIINDNKVGQIVLKGKSVAKGYINYSNENFNINPKGIDTINPKVEEDKYFYTGDMGYIDNKMLFFCGRKDRQIKYKGFRIELSEIENHLLKLPEIYQAKVSAKYNCDRVLLLEAQVVCKSGTDLIHVKEQLKCTLPDYMIPKNIYIVDEISVNHNYKSN